MTQLQQCTHTHIHTNINGYIHLMHKLSASDVFTAIYQDILIFRVMSLPGLCVLEFHTKLKLIIQLLLRLKPSGGPDRSYIPLKLN